MEKLPKIAIIGKPNIGKSTLVNRICQTREAIVHEQPKITRDRKYYLTEWNRKSFYLLDTGGADPKSKNKLDLQILIQTKKAIEESNPVIFMIDLTQTPSSLDSDISDILHKSGEKIIFVGNKCDHKKENLHTEDYLELGFGYPIKISAQHGINIGDLLDSITENIDDQENIFENYDNETVPVVSILGRPNSGKSTLFNTFIREERAIVDDVEGTTRDSIDSIVKIGDKHYRFIDTAGLKKTRQRSSDLDYYSNLRAERAAGSSDLALVLIDSSLGQVTRQDIKIIDMCITKGTGVCTVFSKYDLIDEERLKKLIKELDHSLKFASYIPFLKISSKTKKGFGSLLKMINTIIKEREKTISDNLLTDYLKNISIKNAVIVKGKQFKIKFARQISSSPPSFLIFSNINGSRHVNVKRYVENSIRKEFGFMGNPIFLKFKY
jgi:GTPase